jgi:hypothetical protein
MDKPTHTKHDSFLNGSLLAAALVGLLLAVLEPAPGTATASVASVLLSEARA